MAFLRRVPVGDERMSNTKCSGRVGHTLGFFTCAETVLSVAFVNCVVVAEASKVVVSARVGLSSRRTLRSEVRVRTTAFVAQDPMHMVCIIVCTPTIRNTVHPSENPSTKDSREICGLEARFASGEAALSNASLEVAMFLAADNTRQQTVHS